LKTQRQITAVIINKVNLFKYEIIFVSVSKTTRSSATIESTARQVLLPFESSYATSY